MFLRCVFVLLMCITLHPFLHTTAGVSCTIFQRASAISSLRSMIVPESAVQRLTPHSTLLKACISLTHNVRKVQEQARSVPNVLGQLKRLVPNTIKIPTAAAVLSVKASELRARGISPLLAMVNKKSGGGSSGKKLLQSLRSLLHEAQVCDVHAERSVEALARYQDCAPNMKLLVCGGDGTVSRLVHELFQLNMSNVPIGLVPAGTGNDLASCLSSALFPRDTPVICAEDICRDPARALSAFARPEQCEVDVWSITEEPPHPRPSAPPPSSRGAAEEDMEADLTSRYSQWLQARLPLRAKQRQPAKTMINYFSLGLDSRVSLDFDELRRLKPQLFISRLVNKLWYGVLGLKVLLLQPEIDLSTSVVLVCDGVRVDIPPGTQALVVLNVDSYAGGSRVWQNPPDPTSPAGAEQREQQPGEWQRSRPDDGLLEVRELMNTCDSCVLHRN